MIELLSFLVAILVLVTIHEWGHYWVAKRSGVAIEKFSVGFGKPLFSWKNSEGTEFCIAAIPLGGYVKMRGEYSIATKESQSQAVEGSFASRSVWQRMAIVAARPLVNLLFAAVVFSVLQYGTAKMPAPVLALPNTQSVLAQTGIKDGDTALEINQHAVKNYGDVQSAIIKALLDQERITLKWRDASGNEHISSPLSLEKVSLDQQNWQEQVGLALYQKNAPVGQVVANSPAALAGLKAGDVLIGINGIHTSGNQILNTIQNNPDRAVTLMVQRQNETFSVEVTPKAETLPVNQPGQEPMTVGRIGIQVASDIPMVTEKRGVFKAIYLGVSTTLEQMALNVKGLYKILTGHLSVKNIGGPVTIAKQAGNSAHGGFTQFLGFLAVLSVSLGTLNLLPIPVLDGGHLVYYATEAIRGRPLPEKILVVGQKIGFLLLLLLMGIALFNDAHWFA